MLAIDSLTSSSHIIWHQTWINLLARLSVILGRVEDGGLPVQDKTPVLHRERKSNEKEKSRIRIHKLLYELGQDFLDIEYTSSISASTSEKADMKINIPEIDTTIVPIFYRGADPVGCFHRIHIDFFSYICCISNYIWDETYKQVRIPTNKTLKYFNFFHLFLLLHIRKG